MMRMSMLLGACLVSAPILAAERPAAPPPARIDTLVETLHGQQIADPYRWLEDANAPETKQFVEQQGAYTRALLEKLPGYEALKSRLADLARIGTIGGVVPRGEQIFHTRREGTQNQPVLYVRSGVDGTDRVLIDVNKESSEGTVALDWYKPSHDGKFLLFGMSANGSEISTLRVMEVATGKSLDEAITPARSASPTMLKNDRGFYYARPERGRVPQGEELYDNRLYFHTIGTNPTGDGDPLVFADWPDRKRTDQPSASLSDDDKWVVLTVSRNWSHRDVWVAARDGDGTKLTPKPVAVGKEAVNEAFVYKGNLYLRTNDGASRYKLLVMPAGDVSKQREIVPETDAVLTDVQIADGKLLLSYEKDASSRLKLADLDGSNLRDVPLPGIGKAVPAIGSHDLPYAFVLFQSFTTPATALKLDVATGALSVWKQVETAGFDAASLQVRQVFYPSADGTKIPMFIVAKKGVALDGNNPTLLYGYGGFQISMTPKFSSSTALWLERGGVYAVANLRGGSEYGEAWHRAGMRDKKQNTFDDFAAAAQYLIAEKWTSPERLAIFGGSNGGLLVGAAITQHPELFRAAISAVPLLDMLRYPRFSIAKLWVPEYGDPEKPDEFVWLRAYSPYHNVKPGTQYPATMFVTGDTDTRVDPLHAKKMAARLQQEAKNGRDPSRPILLRIESKAGHGQGKPLSKQIDETTDEYAFLLWQLGIPLAGS